MTITAAFSSAQQLVEKGERAVQLLIDAFCPASMAASALSSAVSIGPRGRATGVPPTVGRSAHAEQGGGATHWNGDQALTKGIHIGCLAAAPVHQVLCRHVTVGGRERQHKQA